MLKNEALSKEYVLLTLADQLDEQTLERLFPGFSPVTVRRIIKEGCSLPQAATDHTPPPQENHPVEKTTEKHQICRLFTDGASRGNPGDAGAGAVLLAENGTEIASQAAYLGRCTNNVAEYKALILGLHEAKQYGCSRLDIALDSELIVRQIQGTYKVKNAALLPLFNEAKSLLGCFAGWTIRHIPRSLNARADQLANQGIDQGKGRQGR